VNDGGALHTLSNILKIMKSVVAMGISGLSIPQKIVKTRFIVTSMTGNTYFGTPNPSLASLTASVNALEVAHVQAAGGGADDTANMHAKEVALDLLLKSLGSYVEGIANASPANAEAIILSAGLNVKGKGGRVAHEFVVKVTGNPGEVKLAHQSVKRGVYEFQMTTDPSTDANWQNIYIGTRGSITKAELKSGTRYYFRSLTIDKNGPSPWSSVLNTVVL
jgi:hypothetical protein